MRRGTNRIAATDAVRASTHPTGRLPNASGQQLQASLDPLDAFHDPVDRDLLPCIGFVAMSQFALYADHRRFETGHTVLQVGDVFADLVDPAANVPQMLKDKVFYVVDHRVLECYGRPERALQVIVKRAKARLV
jgi:hypothetical protein